RRTFGLDGDQHVPFFRPLVRRLRQDRAADSEIKAKDRCDHEKIAARGATDITAIAPATPAFLDLAHHSSPTGASNGLHSSCYSKSLRLFLRKRGPKHQSAREDERRDARAGSASVTLSPRAKSQVCGRRDDEAIHALRGRRPKTCRGWSYLARPTSSLARPFVIMRFLHRQYLTSICQTHGIRRPRRNAFH